MLVQIAKYVMKGLPDPAAYLVARALATRTQRPSVSEQEREALAQASKVRYGERGRNAAWAWGSGPPVVLVHGWGGRAAQMAPLAAQVAQLGFRALAIDITGHGDSPKRHTRWEYFLRDIAAAARSLGEVYAYIGHSAGGLTVMAARRLYGLSAQRYVCVCAPSYPFPPIVGIQRRLDPRPGVVERYKRHIAAQFHTSWEELEAGWAYAGAGSDLLLFYDEMDRYVPHIEGDKIRALCPGARLTKTHTYSHSKVLAAPELARAVATFLERGGNGSAATVRWLRPGSNPEPPSKHAV